MKYLSFIFLVFANCLYAQYQFVSSWYNADNGLAQDRISDIIQDKYGFIWISTGNGIIRYDGTNFVTNKMTDKMSNLYLNNFSGSIEKDSIICYNLFEKEGILISNRKADILNIPATNRKLYYVGNQKYSNFHKNWFSKTPLYDDFIYYLDIKNGKYFIEDNKIEFHREMDKKILPIDINFRINDLNNVFELNDIVYFTEKSNRQTFQILDDKISIIENTSLLNHPESKIYWHQTNKQVFLIDKDHNIYILYPKKNGGILTKLLVNYSEIGNHTYTSIYYDEKYKKLYLGSATKGLNVLTLTNFSVSKKSETYSDNIFYAALPFKSNSVLTEDGNSYDKYGSKKIFENPSPGKYYLNYDSNGNIFYPKRFHIYKRYASTNFSKVDSIKFEYDINGVFKIENNYSVAFDIGHSKRLFIVYEDENFKKILSSIEIDGYIFSVFKFTDDLIYISCSEGLHLFSISKNKIVETYLSGISVKHLVKDTDGFIWITTSKNGIYLVKNGKLIKFPLDKNGDISTAHYLLEDSAKNFWIPSNNGLFKVKKQMFLNFAEKKTSEVFYYKYSKKDGFLNNEFNGGGIPTANHLESGEFVFPSMEGLLFFKPQEILSYYPAANNLHVEYIYLEENEFVEYSKDLKLNSSINRLDFHLDFPYFGNLDNVHLEFRLIGDSDKKWKTVPNSKIISLNTLVPKDYVLEVRFLINDNNEFSYQNFPFVIEPEFYQTLWFKIILSILSIICIVFIIQWRTNFLHLQNRKLKNIVSKGVFELIETNKKLKSEENYRKQIIKTINHDISTPIKYLSTLSQKLASTDDLDQKKKYMLSIHQFSEQLYTFTLTLKDYTDIYKNDAPLQEEFYFLNDLVAEKFQLFTPIAASNQTRLKQNIKEEIYINLNKKMLSVILQNLVDNAIKNTNNGEILLKAFVNTDVLHLEISDTGKGMSQDLIDQYLEFFHSNENQPDSFRFTGLGLHIVIKLIKKFEGKFHIESEYTKGTLFKIQIKLN